MAAGERPRDRRNAIIIRTHFVDEALLSCARALAAPGTHEVIFALDAASGLTQVEGFKSFMVSKEAYAALHLFVAVKDVLWRCGDYVLALAMQLFPDHPYFWMMEYDVFINRPDPASLFAEIDAASGHDFIAAYLMKSGPGWLWHGYMLRLCETPYQCFFPLTRLSARAVAHLYRQRLAAYERAHSYFDQAPGHWPNDEAFTASTLIGDGFACADFNDLGRFYTAKSLTADGLLHQSQLGKPDGLIYHPVRRGAQFAQALETKSKVQAGDLAPVILAEAAAAGALADAVYPILNQALACVGDNPSRVFAPNSLALNLLESGPSVEVLDAMTRVLATLRRTQCLELMRHVAAGKGWTLPRNLRNIALGKRAWQSSTSEWSHDPDPARDAERANDGDLGRLYAFHTGEEDNPWWTVDLEIVHIVESVCLYNRRDMEDRLTGFMLKASADGRVWKMVYQNDPASTPGRQIEIDFSPPLVSRFLRVELPGRGFLHFAGIEVFGTRKL